MFNIQTLLCLITGLTLCALAAEVTVLPDNEAETVDVTEKSFANSTEEQTQISETDISVTTHYDGSTEGLFTTDTDTHSPNNSTYIVVIEDPEGGVAWGTLIGIVAGIVSLIGVSAMIIILIVRKMGRYSRP